MLADLESRLAEVLGTSLPAPFAGRVRRRGAAAPGGSGPVVRLGVDAIEPLETDFGAVRPEIVPGSDDLRRVLRLGVTVGITVEPQTADDRAEAFDGVDALIYALDDPQMRSATRLVEPGDQGFLLDWLHLAESEPLAEPNVVVRAEGWFWPVGQVGETGREIARALVREFRLPVRLAVGAPLVAGAAAVELTITLGTTGAMEIEERTVEAAPFGSLAFAVLDDVGGPGLGSLSGGDPGPDGTRAIAVANGSATATYTPPDSAIVEQLVVSAYTVDDDDNRRVGFELARFDLVVTS